MSSHSPTPGVLETDIRDEDVERIASTDQSNDIAPIKMSKSLKAAYKRAKKAREARDARSRIVCAAQRAKREGTDQPFEPVIIDEPVAKVQMLLSDF